MEMPESYWVKTQASESVSADQISQILDSTLTQSFWDLAGNWQIIPLHSTEIESLHTANPDSKDGEMELSGKWSKVSL